jgi:hypothetical protein
MYFDTKNYLKSTRNYTLKHDLNQTIEGPQPRAEGKKTGGH